MIKSITELNEKFYELFSRIAKNRAFLTDQEYKYFHDKLFELYKEEHRTLVLTNEIERKNALYELQERCDELIPRRRFIFFRNRQMKATDKKLKKEFEAYFNKRMEEEIKPDDK